MLDVVSKHIVSWVVKILMVDIVCLFAVSVSELGHFIHPCEDDLVLKCSNEKIPYFNAPLYFENKQQVGKVDEIFGPINDFVSFVDYMLSVTLFYT